MGLIFRRNKSDVWEGRYDRDTYADYPGVGKVTLDEVATHAIKHLRLTDRLDPRKVAIAALWSQDMLFKVTDEPDKKNWKY